MPFAAAASRRWGSSSQARTVAPPAANARAALQRQPLDALLLDDGFQHWALARDLDIVVLDGAAPFGSGCLLPLGTLRESPGALRRAHLVLVRQSGEPAALEPLRARLASLGVQAPLIPLRYRAVDVDEPLAGRSLPVSTLRGAPVRLLSSIGRPSSFETLARSLGAQVAEHRAYPDHYRYAAQDLQLLASGSAPVLTTEKDWMRLEPLARRIRCAAPLWVLRIAVDVVNPDDATLIDRRLAGLRRG